MATNTGFTARETLHVHEAMRCSALGLAKMKMMQTLAQDAELKQFLDQEIHAKQSEVEQLERWAQKIVP